jgi:predicted ester cyclase
MSVKENLQLIDSMIGSYNARDWKGFCEMLSESIIIYVPGEGPCVGHDANIESIKASLAAFPDAQQKKARSFGHGDWVCLQLIESGTNTGPFTTPDGKAIPPTSRRVEMKGVHVAKIQGGKIMEYHE